MKTSLLGIALIAGSVALASAQTPAGPDFAVNTYTPNGQWYARPAYQPNGDFVVVWTSGQQDGDHYGVFARRFLASGASLGAELQVNVQTMHNQIQPDVAVTANGGFVVVWTNFAGPGAPQSYDIRARRYDRDGIPIGGEIAVNSYTTGIQDAPIVDRSPDGGFVVSWETHNTDGSGMGIAARRFDAGGGPVSGDVAVNTYTTSDQHTPDLAVAGDGTFVVVWQDSRPGVFGQGFDASGARLGGEFRVDSSMIAGQFPPFVSAAASGGGFVVVWTSPNVNPRNVAAQRISANGTRVGNEFVVNTTTGYVGAASGLAHDGAGNFVVTWGVGDGSGFLDMRARRFDASGAGRGAEFLVSTYTTGSQRFPKVAADGAGNLVITWSDDNRDGWIHGVFARRFGGLAPAGLVVDSVGNQVLEPGETVDVRPSWRNSNGAPQTFSATLSNIAGPAGAVYAITDSVGDYGTVADGALAPCTDCYGVLVSNPATRPAVHWDASATESILPATQGQQKQWLLHVGRSFTDVPATNGFYRFIETVLHRGVTGGCGGALYCPASSTSREQMAVFVLVAKEGSGYVPPACATPVFPDVPASSPFCRWIEELARRGVVGGCGGGAYCPAASVTREQMAVFVLRTLDPALSPPACTTPVYNDVPATSGFCRWIEELTRRNVVSGCGGGSYCPTAAVTREQMGVFLSATFGLTLYGP